MLTRYRMKKIIKMLESGSIAEVLQLITDKRYFRALRNLEADGCVKCTYADGCDTPMYILLNPEAYAYELHRFELWANRIIGFIAGIAATVTAQLFIQLLA